MNMTNCLTREKEKKRKTELLETLGFVDGLSDNKSGDRCLLLKQARRTNRNYIYFEKNRQRGRVRAESVAGKGILLPDRYIFCVNSFEARN
jgi:hypothetical protein